MPHDDGSANLLSSFAAILVRVVTVTILQRFSTQKVIPTISEFFCFFIDSSI